MSSPKSSATTSTSSGLSTDPAATLQPANPKEPEGSEKSRDSASEKAEDGPESEPEPDEVRSPTPPRNPSPPPKKSEANIPQAVKFSGIPRFMTSAQDFLEDFAVDKRISNAAMKDSTVQIESAINSRNRAIDGHFKTSVFLLHAEGILPAMSGSYRRKVEIAGDMSINILVHRLDGPEWYLPQSLTEIDLSTATHHLVERFPPPVVPAGYVRFNLFCGKVLLVQNSATTNVTSSDLVIFKNVRHTRFSLRGYRSSASRESILSKCQKIEKPYTEARLVAKALATASREQRPLELQLYGPPHEWANTKSGIPQSVCDWAKNLTRPEEMLPRRENLSAKTYLDNLIKDLLYQASAEELPSFEALQAQANAFSEEEAEKALTSLSHLEMSNRNGENVNSPRSRTVAAFPKTIDCHPNDYSYDPSVTMQSTKLVLHFDFEGQTKAAIFKPHRRLLAPPSGISQFSIMRSSAVLDDAFALIAPFCARDQVLPVLVEFHTELESFVPSVSTTKERRDYGFGRRGIYHCEVTTYKVEYRGFWLFLAGDADALRMSEDEFARLALFARQINNQLIAEVVHAGLQPAEVCIIKHVSERNNEDLNVCPGVYLDGFDIVGGRPYSYWPPKRESDYMFYGISGIQRLIPEGVLSLCLKSDRARISGLNSYLLGASSLQITLLDVQNDDVGITREYEMGMNLAAPMQGRAADWWVEIIKGGTPPDEIQPPHPPPINPPPPPPSDPDPTGDLSSGSRRNRRGRGRNATDNSAQNHNADRPPGPVFQGRELRTLSLDEPDEEVGNWFCKAVMSLPRADIRYVLSRCRDLGDAQTNLTKTKEPGMKDIINPKWVENALSFVRLPNLGQVPGSSKNWFMPYDACVSIPEIFRKKDDGTIVADATRPRSSRPKDKVIKNSAGAPPKWIEMSDLFMKYREPN